MSKQTKGLHHISAICGDGQRNADFYTHALGLEMIMKTVNQDDPSVYHIFYSGGSGRPGTTLTFFAWPMGQQGKPGSGEATAVSFAVPSDSMGYWAERFGEQGIDFEGPFERFGKQVMRFQDPDRLQLELVFDPDIDDLAAWSEGTIPAEHGIRGFWGTTLRLVQTEATARVLTTIFGFEAKTTKDNATLYSTGNNIGGHAIIEDGDPKTGKNGRGIVHHVAFRAKDTDELAALRQQVQDMGLSPTEIIDRDFFQSVYFRSPGSVLFEIATDGPGYKSAEDEQERDQKLYLPEWLEPRRDMIEKRLPEITV